MIEEISAAQHGVISRPQALAAGLTSEQIKARLRGRRWQRVFEGIYATFTGPLPRPAVLWAVLLHAGRDAMLSHLTAAEVCGLTRASTEVVHVTVPAQRRVTPVPGVVVHRSRRAAALRHPTRTPPQTRIEETVLDLTQTARDLDQAITWLARACAQRLTTTKRLTAAVSTRSRLRWRAELVEAIRDVGTGCHSLLELRYLRDVERRHGLPPGVRQRVRVRRGGRWYDDVHYPDFATTVELDGRAAHPDEARWRDMARDNAGVAAGESVLRYGSADVLGRPCEVAVQLGGVLGRRGWAGAPVSCGATCAVGQLDHRGVSWGL